MTKHHEIDLDGLQEWLADAYVTFASSTRERKALVATVKGNLQVLVNGVVVWQGIQPFGAVEAYNAITEKFNQN